MKIHEYGDYKDPHSGFEGACLGNFHGKIKGLLTILGPCLCLGFATGVMRD